MSRLLDVRGPAQLGGEGLAHFETVVAHTAYRSRYLTVRGARAYEAGNGCGTCEFWFTRLEGANGNVSVDAVRDALSNGLATLDDPVVARFADVLEERA